MDKENLQKLTSTEYYVILSNNTGLPYLNELSNCVLFDAYYFAEAYTTEERKKINSIDTFSIKEKEKIEISKFLPEMYALGASNIEIHQKEEISIIPIMEDDAKRNKKNMLFNTFSSRYIIKAQEFHRVRDLRALKHQKFYAAAYIAERKKGEYPQILYCYAECCSNKFFVFFTSLDNFEKWKASQSEEYFPLEVNIQTLNRIRKDTQIVVNPLENKFFLSKKMLDYILSEGDVDEN